MASRRLGGLQLGGHDRRARLALGAALKRQGRSVLLAGLYNVFHPTLFHDLGPLLWSALVGH